MNLEEKLENFYNTSMEDARQESAKELKGYRKALKKIFTEHQEEAVRKQKLTLQTETTENQQISNMEIAREQMAMKREISQKEEELTEQLFAETKELLADFKKKPEYLALMERQVKYACDFSQGEQFILYIDPSDEPHLARLRAAATENAQILVSKEEFGGGTRAVLHSMNILIDNSFKKRFAEVKEDFRLSHAL